MNTSKIEWTESTWNPSTGCSKVSEGCKNCYAETLSKRLQAMGTPGYGNGFEFSILKERLYQPINIKKPTRFFVNSMSDLFHKEMPDSYLDDIFNVIQMTPQHTYQILTKRELRIENYFTNRTLPSNVWLGVTVENSNNKHRIEYLRKISAKIRFLSLEPLLSNIEKINLTDIHWVIVGGESGTNARPMKMEWVTKIHNQCINQNVAFFFKQWGSWGSDGVKRNKKNNGRLLFGKEWSQYPVI